MRYYNWNSVYYDEGLDDIIYTHIDMRKRFATYDHHTFVYWHACDNIEREKEDFNG